MATRNFRNQASSANSQPAFGTTYVLAAKPEFKVLARNQFTGDRGDYNASVTPHAGRLYLPSDKYLYCIGEK